MYIKYFMIYYFLNKPWQLFVMFRYINACYDLSICVKWAWDAKISLGSGLKIRGGIVSGNTQFIFLMPNPPFLSSEC